MRRAPMNSADAIYDAVAPRLAHERQEHVLIILLDTKLRGVRTIELSKGNTDSVLCEPRDVLHQAIINQCPAFVLVHNHPSGDPAPSQADFKMTRRIFEASKIMGIRMVDHMIIGRPSERQEAFLKRYWQTMLL